MKSLILAILICGPAYAQHSHHESAHHAEVKRKALAQTEKTVLLEVLQKNDILFNAFLKKDGKEVEKAALELNKIISSSNSKILGSVYKQSSNLLNIKATNTIEANLKNYELFLNPLITIVKANDAGSKFNIFSCPMVKKSWIQNIDSNKNVRNVYAMEMLECGEQETHFN